MQPVDCQWSVLFGVAEEQFVGLYCAETSAGRDKSHLCGGHLILALWSVHSFLGLGPAATYPGYSVAHVSFCFPYTCLLGDLHFILCAVSQCAARAVWALGSGTMDSFCTIKLGFQGWILSILLVRAVNQWGAKELVESWLAESVWHYEELGAGVGFLLWISSNELGSAISGRAGGIKM